MERLDYRINEDGIERWISHDKVMNILVFLYPALAEEIEQKMRLDDKPFEYTWSGKKCRIEYKGPGSDRCEGRRFADKLSLLCLAVLLMTGVGCTQYKKLTNSDDPKSPDEKPHAFYVVSCCRDNNAGVMTYPAFVPASHVQLCENVRVAERTNDSQINGDTYLAMDVDCGKWGYKIGDEYYAGHGY